MRADEEDEASVVGRNAVIASPSLRAGVTRTQRVCGACVGLALTLLLPASAAAQTAREDPTLRPVTSERRNGLVLGASAGVAAAGASGFPNNAKLIGDPAYYSRSPLLVGSSASYFLMGALTDYLSFGPMVNVANFENARWKSTGFGLGFRLEVFPFVALVPTLADTAIYTQLGFGVTELQAKGDFPSAEARQSFLGLGLHHEFRLTRLLGGHVAAGPHVEYDVIRADSAERHWATVGLRLAWYGGRVTADGP